MGNSDNSGGGGFLLGLVIGGALGAALALLYAPQRGEDTRGFVAQKSTEYASAAKAKTSEMADTLRQNAASLGDKAGDVVDTLKSRASDVSNRASDMVSNAKDTAQNAINQGKEAFNQKKQELEASAANADSKSNA